MFKQFPESVGIRNPAVQARRLQDAEGAHEDDGSVKVYQVKHLQAFQDCALYQTGAVLVYRDMLLWVCFVALMFGGEVVSVVYSVVRTTLFLGPLSNYLTHPDRTSTSSGRRIMGLTQRWRP